MVEAVDAAEPRDTAEAMSSGRPLVPEDVARLRVITDLDISADGRQIAYVVKEVDWDSDAYTSSIWIVDRHGARAPLRLTDGDVEDRVPRWSSDGRLVAFTSNRPLRGSVRNLFVVDIATRQITQLTKFEDDVSDERTYPVIAEAFAWAPDGAWLCVSVKDTGSGPPPHTLVYDRLRYKSGDYGWWDGRRKHLWRVPVDGSTPIRLTSGDWDAFGPAISPDGRWVAFSSPRNFASGVANALPDSNPYQPKDIWLAAADGSSEPRCLTDSDGPNMSPAFSPDGNRIAYFGHQVERGAWGYNTHLWVRDIAGGPPRDLLAGWDHPAGSQVMSDVHDVLAPTAWWSTDASTIYFVGTVRGEANLYGVTLDSGSVTFVTTGHHEVQQASFSKDRSVYAALIGDETRPSDLYAADIDGEPGRLTSLNDEFLAEVNLPSAERFQYQSPDALEIDGYILRSQRSDDVGPRPTVLQIFPSFVHGPGFNFEYQMLASNGYVVFYANPRGASSYGEKWLDTGFVRGHWFADFDDQLAGLDWLIERGIADRSRLGVTGDAYGGTMTNWIIGRTNRFAASVARRGGTSMFKVSGDRTTGVSANPYRDPQIIADSSLYLADEVTTPHLMIHSIDDRRGSVGEVEELFVLLRSAGKEARLVLFRNDVHFLSRMGSPRDRAEFFGHIKGWFDTHLHPEAGQGTGATTS